MCRTVRFVCLTGFGRKFSLIHHLALLPSGLLLKIGEALHIFMQFVNTLRSQLLVSSLWDWCTLCLADYLSRTNLRSYGQRYTREAPESNFAPNRAHHWCISFALIIWTRVFQLGGCVNTVPPIPIRANHSYPLESVQTSFSNRLQWFISIATQPVCEPGTGILELKSIPTRVPEININIFYVALSLVIRFWRPRVFGL